MASVAQRKRAKKARLTQERRRTGTPTILVESTTITEGLSRNDLRDAVSPEVDQWAGPQGNGRWTWIRDDGQDDDGQHYLIVNVEGDSTTSTVDPGDYRVNFEIDTETLAVTLGDVTEVKAHTEYVPVTPPAGDVTEAELLGDTITLSEAAAAIDDDGIISLKVIQPGWGSSGYYPAEVLESDGPTAFPAGIHMYWDHPTETDELERPERSLRDLAAVTVTEATWDPDGPEGPGLYADARPFAQYADVIAEMAPHIGVSIRAAGTLTEGEAEGRSGGIVESIDDGRSIDFVTAAGAGGQVLALFESARTTSTSPVPAPPAPTPTPDPLKETDTMDLTEAKRTISTLEESITERDDIGAALAYQLAEAERTNARLTEARNIGIAREHATTALAESPLSNAARTRVINQVSTNPPLTENGDIDTDKLTEAVTAAETAELDYLQENGLVTGRPRNLGDAPNVGGDLDDEARFAERKRFFTESMGLSDAEAELAVKGR